MDGPAFEYEFNSICRLCLSRDRPLTCLFSNGPDEIPLNLIAQTCAAVDINEEDGLPRNICCACRDTIIFSYQFRQQVCRNDTILRGIAGMKAEPDEEKAVVTVMAYETPVLVGSGGSELQDESVDSKEDAGRKWFNSKAEPVQNTTISFTDSVQARKSQEIRTDSAKSHPLRNKNCLIPVQNSDVSSEIHTKIIEYGTPYGEGYYCKQCKGFFNRRKFITHIERLHLRDRDFICEECGRSFFTKWFLTNHIQSLHLDQTSAEVPAKMKEYGTHAPKSDSYCKLRKKLFLQHNHFLNHVKFTDPTIRNFMCDHCGYRTTSKRNVAEHINGIHLHVKKYQCPRCPLRFCTRQHRYLHARSHRPHLKGN